MRLICTALLSGAILTVCPPASSLADTSDGLDRMWECPQAEGSSVYTNKERADCQDLVSINGGLASWQYGNGTDRKDPGLES
jgi:hypothetical protein